MLLFTSSELTLKAIDLLLLEADPKSQAVQQFAATLDENEKNFFLYQYDTYAAKIILSGRGPLPMKITLNLDNDSELSE